VACVTRSMMAMSQQYRTIVTKDTPVIHNSLGKAPGDLFMNECSTR